VIVCLRVIMAMLVTLAVCMSVIVAVFMIMRVMTMLVIVGMSMRMSVFVFVRHLLRVPFLLVSRGTHAAARYRQNYPIRHETFKDDAMTDCRDGRPA
jgi:hypothetical protein